MHRRKFRDHPLYGFRDVFEHESAPFECDVYYSRLRYCVQSLCTMKLSQLYMNQDATQRPGTGRICHYNVESLSNEFATKRHPLDPLTHVQCRDSSRYPSLNRGLSLVTLLRNRSSEANFDCDS